MRDSPARRHAGYNRRASNGRAAIVLSRHGARNELPQLFTDIGLERVRSSTAEGNAFGCMTVVSLVSAASDSVLLFSIIHFYALV